ncbi:universal stress protein [Kocuria turfanensis]|uniref:UspA domain-containing protein n=1 Tax=Kocuria turfanensis TaxID=388357 RepID=A0A512ICN9_9MICC|nr:universal stress protein [Kocuria turfanensis]GEO95407.1 hypothetical protein KTU01_15300 [Kocuria turfanensis]
MSDIPTGDRVVVGVDGSAASAEALREGARWAQVLDAPLDAVMCWDSPYLDESYSGITPEEFRAEHEQRFAAIFAEVFGDERPERLTTRLVRGRAAERLLEESEGARMLVVGRRGTGRVLRTVLGSVSSALVSHARCPVLVVHP